MLRSDLAAVVRAARTAGLYTNLLTSGLGLTRPRAEELREAGLDSVQVSFQADEAPLADALAGMTAHSRKLAAAQLVRELGLPLTVNVVLHRGNLEHLPGIIALVERLGAERLELAHTQYYGWAHRNRAALLPSREQVGRAEEIARRARERLRGRMDVLYVLPDYHGERPKPCMNGWGQRYLTVNPSGDVLPCPSAGVLPGLRFENVRSQPLARIWLESEAFNRYRGTAWMPEPCRSCSERTNDFGGCRCQAYLLTGDASATDPACSLSPHRGRLLEVLDRAEQADTRSSGVTFLEELHFRSGPAATS